MANIHVRRKDVENCTPYYKIWTEEVITKLFGREVPLQLCLSKMVMQRSFIWNLHADNNTFSS